MSDKPLFQDADLEASMRLETEAQRMYDLGFNQIAAAYAQAAGTYAIAHILTGIRDALEEFVDMQRSKR